MDSSTVSQPGAYTAKLAISTNSPYEFAPIGIAMQVNPPATWGEIVGTVNDASGHPITGATVQICTMYDPQTGTCGPVTYTLKTDILGDYRLWLNHGFSPLQIIAAKDGYQPVAKIATITKGTTTTVNFALNKTPSEGGLARRGSRPRWRAGRGGPGEMNGSLAGKLQGRGEERRLLLPAGQRGIHAGTQPAGGRAAVVDQRYDRDTGPTPRVGAARRAR
jgi:hypothetical protein